MTTQTQANTGYNLNIIYLCGETESKAKQAGHDLLSYLTPYLYIIRRRVFVAVLTE